MYARRIQITNYGPIEQLDIEFPFDEQGRPKPVVLVGANGSGKSIFLSHIVNGLVAAKGVAYHLSPEVPLGHVYKTRSAIYITSGREYYFARVDYSNGLSTTELHAMRLRGDYREGSPDFTEPDAITLWNSIDLREQGVTDAFGHHPPLAPSPHSETIQGAFAANCILYFPADRFEDPGWLAAADLPVNPKHNQGGERVAGTTTRRVIASSMLRDLQDWLLDVVLSIALTNTTQSDQGRQALKAVEEIITEVVGWRGVRFSLGERGHRTIGITSSDGQMVHNVFQLSSGETSLLTLFLSILRDYDLCEQTQLSIPEVRGIVVIDEIDLHLHAKHQHDVLPRLMRRFPQVQFIVTTHSPLFVLGMNNAFGDDGFALYEMPQGQPILAEEFREFGNAYQAFAETRRHAAEVRMAIEQANSPVVYLEGPTDVRYVRRAAELLGRLDVLDGAKVLSAGGESRLKGIWTALDSTLAQRIGQKVVLVADCDSRLPNAVKGHVFWRRIAKIETSPVEKGIENLFAKETLERAREQDPKFFTEVAHIEKELPEQRVFFDRWAVQKERKVDLCNWLCDNGTAEDFKDFAGVLDTLEEILQSVS